ncbi:T9SS type A sorting domain-containing protein [Adhaeribacter sp. BT258]|uniref:T9SS type A sorting domain-containing protein n=1 Tax=Adhaeribacter terrigena TaxID=2793070 RepID=A0ABS1C690_9BACT|nr:T9SS type A sorting domain-containing protein [Adhaeribacter terrigena]MBK0404882.1 T9SS type A sorting domain-containing protein [Adhaeribacter terrigena]
MKKLLSLITILLAANFYAQAQTLLYSENFSGTVNNMVTVNNSWVSATASPNTTTGASGGRYLATAAYSPATTTTFYLSGLNTAGYNNIKISWNARKANNTNTIALAYSTNGLNYTTVAGFNDVPANGTWAAVNGGTEINLPVAAAQAANLYLRWTVAVSNGRSYFIDDLKITGTPDEGISSQNWNDRPNNEDPFVVSSPTAANPYTTEGVSMRFSKQTASGVNLTTAVLSDATFQNPTRTLTLIQNSATTTRGTTITTTFGKAVSDLTFTMFDVDRNAGQYFDAIKIEGYQGSTLVQLQKKDVITTSYNEFVEGSNLVQAVANGTNVATNSTNGNVTVKFSEPVDRIVFTYNNLDAAAGNQGIAINSFSWKTAPAPLPVTLTSFTGKLVNKQTELHWATASEKNNDKFLVERSLDGRKFETIGTVKGNGTTNAAQHYTFTDARPAQGTNYYRLKQTDFDGATEYSKIVAVKNTTAVQTELVVYPVPATSEITVSLHESAGLEKLQIFSLAGNLVKQANLNGRNNLQLTIPISELPAGYYLVQVSGAQNSFTKKIVKQ